MEHPNVKMTFISDAKRIILLSQFSFLYGTSRGMAVTPNIGTKSKILHSKMGTSSKSWFLLHFLKIVH